MAHQVSSKEIAQIRAIVENATGTLMCLQDGNFNEAEKMRLFITCTRVLGRSVLWGTTLNHFQLHYFIWRISFGLTFDLDLAIDYMIQYGCAILNEIEFYEDRMLQQNLVEKEEEDIEDFIEIGDD